MLIKQINNDTYQVLKDPLLYNLYSCLEEIQLWKGENPMDIEAGIDYFGIFENRRFIETELSRVIDKHSNCYQSYSIENLTYNDGVLSLSIIFTIDSQTTYKFNLHMENYNG